jgi:ParB-like chromosome segregation protein Spo0J
MATKKQSGPNRLEKFEVVTINRQKIQNAEYNPRTITADAEKKLRKSLRDFGALAPITWNKRTGNIVGGHQRVAAMDSILKKSDYDLQVAVVDLDPETEVKANVVLNNPAVQGEWDHEKLAEIKIEFPEIDFQKDLGFDKFDIDMFFAGTDLEEEVKDEVDRMREVDQIKQAKKKGRDEAKEQNEQGAGYNPEKDDYMVTFVFPNNEEKHDFMKHIKESAGERYVRHTKLYDIQDGKLSAYGSIDE